MNSLIHISEISNKKFEESNEPLNYLARQWFERGCIPPHYYPVIYPLEHDLLVIFPDTQRIVDVFLTDVIGMNLASINESKCWGVRFHEGFLRNLTHVNSF